MSVGNNFVRDIRYAWLNGALTRVGADRNILENYIRELRVYEACVIKARPVGFFSLWLEVVGQLYACKQAGVKPTVYFGPDCLYWDESRLERNVWDYYFEPVSDIDWRQVDERKAFQSSRYLYGVIPERWVDEERRRNIGQIISDKIKIRPEILEQIERRNGGLIAGRKFVSVHARGTAKSEDLRYQYRGVLPLEYYWREVDRYLHGDADLAVYLATDSEEIVNKFKKRYGDRLFTSQVKRSEEETGEIHLKGGNFELGLEVLADCCLLRKGVALVHGVSNVSFAAAYWEPELKHIDVYQKYAWQSRRRWLWS